MEKPRDREQKAGMEREPVRDARGCGLGQIVEEFGGQGEELHHYPESQAALDGSEVRAEQGRGGAV